MNSIQEQELKIETIQKEISMDIDREDIVKQMKLKVKKVKHNFEE